MKAARMATTGAAALVLAGGITLMTAGPGAAYTGRATHYDVGLGACGVRSSPGEMVVALNSAEFGSGYPGPHCFQKIRIQHGTRSIVATIVDEAPGAPFHGLDLSAGAFQALGGNVNDGVMDVSWDYVGAAPKPGPTTKPPTPKPTSTTKPPTPKPTTTTKAPTPKPTTTTKAPTPKPTTTTKAPTPRPTTTTKPPAVGPVEAESAATPLPVPMVTVLQ
ncbi:RlpA-like double-psi beta-barrel domain-containing protein [Kitasatospora griseola]|uniref:RlpA-like double-psi beta-barrel domain-containing protein n=1 Tax=Kitasatospora griseola TaxID=2064 RepID=UPI00382DF9A8